MLEKRGSISLPGGLRSWDVFPKTAQSLGEPGDAAGCLPGVLSWVFHLPHLPLVILPGFWLGSIILVVAMACYAALPWHEGRGESTKPSARWVLTALQGLSST